MNLFAPLAMKVSGGIIAILLGVCLFLYLNGLGESRRADKLQIRLTETNAKLEIQNEAIADMEADMARRKKAAEDALQRAKQGSAKAEEVARRIESPAPLSGKCRTSDLVLRADL